MIKGQFINRNISILYRYGQKFLTRKLKLLSPSLEVGQLPFLLQVYKHPGITQDQISANAAMDKGTCARGVKQLEQLNLIIRETDKNDRRINHIYPSCKALSIKEGVYNIIKELHEVLYNGFSQEEIVNTISILNRMKENMANCLNDNKSKP